MEEIHRKILDAKKYIFCTLNDLRRKNGYTILQYNCLLEAQLQFSLGNI